jgi:hypothetical protein
LLAVASNSNVLVTAVSVGICDQFCHATLTLHPPSVSSAQEWETPNTILLISSAKLLRGGRITATGRTQIEVDPKMAEAASLRRWVQQDHCPINETFPNSLFDADAVETSPLRLQFTLASLHSFIDAAPAQVHSGYLSVILAELCFVSLYQKQRIFSMECCRMPIYGNGLKGICGQCGTERQLRVNPDMVGEIADEMGAIYNDRKPLSTLSSPHGSQSGKRYSRMFWSDEAWTNLLGRTPEEFAEWLRQGQMETLQALQDRLSYMRVIMMVGWTGEYGGGRLAILKIVQ